MGAVGLIRQQIEAVFMAKLGQRPQVRLNAVVAGSCDQNGSCLWMGRNYRCQQFHCYRPGKTRLSVCLRKQVYGRDVQKGHGVIDALMAAPIQDQGPAHANGGSQHGLNALGGPAGEEQRVLRAAQACKELLRLPDRALSGIQVSRGRQLREIQRRDRREAFCHPSLVAGHMKPQRLPAGQAGQGIIKGCVHVDLPRTFS